MKDKIRKISNAGPIPTKDMLRFREECRNFITLILKKLQTKSPLNKKLVRGFSFLDPSLFGKQLCISRLNLCLQECVSEMWLSGLEADEAKKQFMLLTCDSRIIDKALQFNRTTDRLDEFWLLILKEKPAARALDTFIRKILTLSHGQASIERGFSINKDAIVENQKESSLIAQRLVYDSIKNVNLEEMEVSKKLIWNARNAHRYWQDAQQLEKENGSREEQKKLSAKRKADELISKETERKKIKHDMEASLLKLDSEINELKYKP